jgi:hypothetical protein
LSGLFLISISPIFKRYEFLSQGVILQIVHVLISLLYYYGEDGRIPYISTWKTVFDDFKSTKSNTQLVALRKMSIIFGSIATALLLWWWWVDVESGHRWLAIATLFTSFQHFFCQEADYKGALGVRPFGYVPVGASFIAIGFILSRFVF